MISRNIFALALGCLLSAGACFAQDGGEAMSFVRMDRDPVSAGMGFAGAASASGTAYSSFRNASVIPLAEKKFDAGFSWQNWAPKGAKTTDFNFGAAFKARKKIGFAIGAAMQNGEEYSVMDDMGNAKGTFKPSEMVINGGFGMMVLKNLSAGVNVRYASQKISSDNSYSAFGADAFVTYCTKDLNVTAGVSSIGSAVKSDAGDSFSLPASVTVGVAWSKDLKENHGIELAADADYYFSGKVAVAAGAEYSFKDMVFARAGYHFGTSGCVLPSFASLGAGFSFAGASLNVAWLFGNEALANTLTVGLGYKF